MRDLDVDAVADQLTELLSVGLCPVEAAEASFGGEAERLASQLNRLERLVERWEAEGMGGSGKTR